MKLNEYIRKTLADIVNGTMAAREDLKDDVALCVHTDKEYNGHPSVSYTSAARIKQAPLTVVGFKVRVQVSDSVSADGKVEADVLNVVGGSVSGERSFSDASVHEVTFSIPIVWKQKQDR